MRSLPSTPVFTTAEATKVGLTSSALKHAVKAGVLLRPRRGVYRRADAPEESTALAAATVIRGAVVSHRSAARLHGLPLLGRGPLIPEVTLAPGRSGEHPRVHVYRATLRPQDVVVVSGTEVTAVPRTCIDVARHGSLDAAVVLIDAALQRGLVTMEELDDVQRHCWNWTRIRRAQRAVMLSDGRAESPLESISRLVIPRLGFAVPEPQRRIYDAAGDLIGRGDFYWDELGVIGEADGRLKYREDDAFPREKVRQEAFEDLNLVVVRWGWDFAWRRHDLFRRKLDLAAERARRRDRSGLPRLWTL